jgi:transcriptional regulator GlxA family with amidase domain
LKSFAHVLSPDVVVVSGTLGGDEHDEVVVEWLRRVHPDTQWTTSVCTGSICLAAAGILDGLDARTHRASKDHLEEHAPATPSGATRCGHRFPCGLQSKADPTWTR